ncbi:MAG: transcriptional repressor [Fimbriimonadales bacterium]
MTLSCNTAPPEQAELFESRALELLKEAGFRVTKPRVIVIRALGGTRRPLGAYQIRDLVGAAGGKIDVVSIYRILAVLEGAGLVHRIGAVDGYLACTGRPGEESKTLHLICKKCGCVEELPLTQAAGIEIGVAASRQGFLSENTFVEAVGVCEHCR